MLELLNHRMHATLDHVAHPEWCKTEACYCQDKNDDRETLVPSGISEFEMMLIGRHSIEDFTDKAQDVDRGDDDGGTSDDGHGGVERAGVLERAYKDGHFGYETRKTGKTEVSQTCDDIADSEERHNLHQACQLADVTRVGATIDETDEGEEECRHQSVRKHLKDGTCASGFGGHADGEEHESAVRNR